jgi:DNA-binding beta-propeller fold protein YncE
VLFFRRFAIVLSLSLGWQFGCAAPPKAPQWIYYPPPPDPGRVVHLLSFNRLNELVPPPARWTDFLRGPASGPWVGTPLRTAYRDDTLYICDTATNQVHVWNIATGTSSRIGAEGSLGKPVAVAVGADGVIYVADTVREEVIAFESGGEVLRRYRSSSAGSYRPVALALSDSRLYVSDMVQHRVDVYATATGQYLDSIGRPGGDEGEFYYPAGLALGSAGQLYVSDMMNSRIQVFDRDGRYTHSVGSPGGRYGNLGKPKDVAVASDGTLWIADAEFACLHLFNSAGRLLLVIGGVDDRLAKTALPNGVAVADELPKGLARLLPEDFVPSYFVWISNTTGRHRLSLYAVGLKGL